MDDSTVDSSWCSECHRHIARCECGSKQHIYLVEYLLRVDTGPEVATCQQKVRCVATDKYLAMSRVSQWAKTTNMVWWETSGAPEEFQVPPGTREVTIINIHMHAQDVGDIIKQIPLPVIFPNE